MKKFDFRKTIKQVAQLASVVGAGYLGYVWGDLTYQDMLRSGQCMSGSEKADCYLMIPLFTIMAWSIILGWLDNDY